MQEIRPHLEEPAVVLIMLEGNLVRHEDLELERLVQELLDKDCRRIILDFTRVDFIDSAGIGLIIKLASMADKQKGSLILCNAQKNVKNVFSMLGIEQRFKIFNRLADGLLNFGRLVRLEIISVKF